MLHKLPNWGNIPTSLKEHRDLLTDNKAKHLSLSLQRPPATRTIAQQVPDCFELLNKWSLPLAKFPPNASAEKRAVAPKTAVMRNVIAKFASFGFVYAWQTSPSTLPLYNACDVKRDDSVVFCVCQIQK